jgi:hypothetical protein
MTSSTEEHTVPDDDQQPDLTGEIEREYEAATGGMAARAAVLDIDLADDDLDPGEHAGDADEGDDDAAADDDDEPVDASL